MISPTMAGAGLARPGEIRLSTVEMDACFELLGLGDTPLALQLPSPGRTGPERQEHLDAVVAELHRRGLAKRNRPNEQVARLLRVLARPDRQLDLFIHGAPGGALVAIGAASSDYGTLAVRQGDHVALASIRGAALVPAVVGLIGPVSPGRGATVNVPADVFDAALKSATDGQLSSLVERLTEMGLPHADVSPLVHMCRGISALGQLGTVHDPGRSARLGPWVVGFHRTDAGYYLQLRKPSTYGGETVTICPVDAPRLAQLAQELLDAGPARQPQHRRTW